jgi:long-chain acyl-CoA synthetase
MFFDRVEKSARYEAFGKLDDGKWTSLTWRRRRSGRGAGRRPARVGIEPEQRVGIASSTRYEWILADVGRGLRRAVTAPGC